MPPSTELPQVGKWVQVLKGTYKGDVGYVLSTASQGLELLLVPHIFLPDQLGSKRKQSPTMALLMMRPGSLIIKYLTLNVSRRNSVRLEATGFNMG
jgi:hypothetical protein